MALSTTTKIGLGAVLAGALGYLVLSDSGEGVFEYMYVEQVVAAPDHWMGKRIQAHGTVVDGSIKKKKGSSGDYTFVVEHGGKRMNVHFTNIPPDTFQEGGEVVLTGELEDVDGTLVFESDEMSAKCPSKYEEEQAVKVPGQQG